MQLLYYYNLSIQLNQKMLHKRLEEQQKTIQFIKEKYKKKTGQQIQLPKKWEDYLLLQSQQTPSQPLPIHIKQKKAENLQEAIDKLQLPSRLSFNKPPLTSFSAHNPFHMIQVINLNGFKQKGFSKILMRELLNRVTQMRCLKAINLNRNGIDQSYIEQIQALFTMKRVTRIDLSRNQMNKPCLQMITKNFNHLEWLDISRNNWIFQTPVLQTLVNVIRTNTKLYHICLDLQDEKLVKQLCGYLKIKTNIHSFSLIDTKIDLQSMQLIGTAMEATQGKKQNGNRIISLNFTYCYLQNHPYAALLKAISGNNTLISLNLSGNQLKDSKAIQLCSIIQSSISLIDINLQKNQLQDKFALTLAQCLKKNEIVQIINIANNNISDEGAKSIFQTLGQNNDTLQSLGQIQTNERISLQLLQKIKKALRINKISKDIRAQLSKQQGQLSAVQIANRQTQAFLQAQYQQYQLLQPIAITNPIRQDPYKLVLWDFD